MLEPRLLKAASPVTSCILAPASLKMVTLPATWMSSSLYSLLAPEASLKVGEPMASWPSLERLMEPPKCSKSWDPVKLQPRSSGTRYSLYFHSL